MFRRRDCNGMSVRKQDAKRIFFLLVCFDLFSFVVCLFVFLKDLKNINGVLVVDEFRSTLPEKMTLVCINALVVILCMMGTVISPCLSLHQF